MKLARVLGCVLLLWVVSIGAAEELKPLSVTVDGVERIALIHVPPDAKAKAPLVFVFHGHGGSSRNAERTFQTDRLWPDAISVYPQGLPTPGQLTDADGRRPGWQARDGDQNDRDLEFFDALLRQMQRDYAVDPHRVYCTGHSNGGGFTYLLWRNRPQAFAAVAISAAAAPYAASLTPKPAMILGGQNDPLVRFAWQQRMMNVIRKINGCDATAQPWRGDAKIYPSATGTPLVTFIHNGGHPMDAVEPNLIVQFFQAFPAEPTTRP